MYTYASIRNTYIYIICMVIKMAHLFWIGFVFLNTAKSFMLYNDPNKYIDIHKYCILYTCASIRNTYMVIKMAHSFWIGFAFLNTAKNFMLYNDPNTNVCTSNAYLKAIHSFWVSEDSNSNTKITHTHTYTYTYKKKRKKVKMKEKVF